MQIQLEKTLDVEVVERQLAELWKQTTGERDSDSDTAVLRARVANLLVFVASDALLNDADQMMQELTASHPSRVLIMLGDRQAADRDIEMYVASICQRDKRTGAGRLSCEEVTLKAYGNFAAELPSAALPLLIPDLSTFLWWQDALRVSDKVFDTLVRRADRLVIDSAEFKDPSSELLETDKLFAAENCENLGISDLNWARLTLWRSLLADFYDVPAYQPWLDEIDYVRIDYVGPELAPVAVAPQALLIAGWLASRLEWSIQSDQSLGQKDQTIAFKLSGKKDRSITLELNRVERAERKPGRLARVELRSHRDRPASFTIARSVNNLHLLAEAKLGPEIHRGRVLPVRNRSVAQLLSREMEILCNDDVYAEAISMAIQLLGATK
ncbi:MAG: glucose-6-phosphate dehydrogenase assembly protein OpcA [Acidobacteriota bacterium]|nr:glucose-6-phosphate dehydrogenase assembly protein OpcA [Acidobacteriota bacterium]